jgi:ketosteroid isomerase-like protein
MTSILVRGHELYAALASGDAETLRRLLTPDFQGHLSEGMPLGLGRSFDGLEPMMSNGWAAIDRCFEVNPQPDELIDGGGVLIARGNYVGTARPTGRLLRAAFAHFWRFDGQRFTAVQQVTDTAKWHEAIAVA